MSEKILDFLNQAANGNALEAEQTFKELISQKVQDRLEDMRADIMSNEEVEIDELSKKTLDNYTQKSIESHGHANYARRVSTGKDKEVASRIEKNRKLGISRAVKKLTKD